MTNVSAHEQWIDELLLSTSLGLYADTVMHYAVRDQRTLCDICAIKGWRFMSLLRLSLPQGYTLLMLLLNNVAPWEA